MAASDLTYQPIEPKHYQPHIALIGCGGISEWHLHAYRQAGYNVTALCDRRAERAESRQTQYYPDASVYTDANAVLAENDIEVVDIATHPQHRIPLIEQAIDAGKHVLSQKPFVLDLETGRRLVDKARQKGVKLAVNQNGRWSPHWCYLRRAVQAGLPGQLQAVDFSVYWDHNWVAETPFDEIRHLLLYDFAIHWFDMAQCLAGETQPDRVFAMLDHGAHQRAKPALQAQVVVSYPTHQVSMAFRGNTGHGPSDRTRLVGDQATFESLGADLNHQRLTQITADGRATFTPKGHWFPQGFHGAMAELLCAIESDRLPENDAANNLASLQLCFAAAMSADRAAPIAPEQAQQMPE
jgi:predicted dehydrogenase